MRKYRAFTLVELLVVISIIALLLAILVPALGKARNQARVTMCAVNAREIANVLALYQAANDGYAPVMLHKFSITSLGIPAKASLLSLPLQPYSGKPATLPVRLDPYKQWIMPFVAEYSRDYLQKFYVCPFVRGSSDASWFTDSGLVTIGVKSTGEVVQLQNYKSTGIGDSYSTWIWPRAKGYVFITNHPYGPDHGHNLYGNVQWHCGGDPVATGIWPDTTNGYLKVKDRPVKFSNIRGIAELTAIFCAQGEIDETCPNGRVVNYRSHMKSNRGGTNVVFGDGHVGWVQGSQITLGN
jgi:prepilin-type N-terminal cleavage/methylation domain-containing protein/prepilin-type processing-associated H-X9-DG protein